MLKGMGPNTTLAIAPDGSMNTMKILCLFNSQYLVLYHSSSRWPWQNKLPDKVEHEVADDKVKQKDSEQQRLGRGKIHLSQMINV